MKILSLAILAVLAGGLTAFAQDAPAAQVTTRSGLRYTVLQPGSGRKARREDNVVVNYTGWLTPDGVTLGNKFDSSVDRDDPFTFQLGEHHVIRGWDEGVMGMLVGEKRRLVIPANLAYGEQGREGTIPANATLIFDIELLKIK
jgi:FKBP-type peptidyl-prolyl cis-trans isomerase